MSFIKSYFEEIKMIIDKIDLSEVSTLVQRLKVLKLNKGRLFILGVGGSAGNASHMVNDIRKIVGIECYAPTDNVSELTARINDKDWESVFSDWLKVSNLSHTDAIFILSVGGGSIENDISKNIVKAVQYALSVRANIFGIVGRDGGYTYLMADSSVRIPTVNPLHITPHSECFQSIIWHLIVTHPDLKINQTKWESLL